MISYIHWFVIPAIDYILAHHKGLIVDYNLAEKYVHQGWKILDRDQKDGLINYLHLSANPDLMPNIEDLGYQNRFCLCQVCD